MNVIITALSWYNQAIKSLGTERSSYQGRYLPIKILDPGRKRFYRRRVCDYPLQQLHDGLHAVCNNTARLNDCTLYCCCLVKNKFCQATRGGSSEPPRTPPGYGPEQIVPKWLKCCTADLEVPGPRFWPYWRQGYFHILDILYPDTKLETEEKGYLHVLWRGY